MRTIQMQVSKMTANPIGSIAGGVAFYYGAKKMGKVENMWALAAITVVGVYVGAMVQSKLMPKGSPTSATVK